MTFARGTTRSQLAEVAELRQRLEQIEARTKTGFSYQGPHQPGTEYLVGQFVTYGGSLWHANRKTTAKPGDGADWTLAVKRGRDSR